MRVTNILQTSTRKTTKREKIQDKFVEKDESLFWRDTQSGKGKEKKTKEAIDT